MSAFRRLLSRLCGLERELEELRQQVRELSWDETFGMWTRGAFMQFCQVMPRGERIVVFLDLKEVHELNGRLGYAEVDRRVRATFSMPFRRSDVAARWYSGDEIVILFDCDEVGAQLKMAELVASAAAQDLTFDYAIGTWEVGKQSIEDAVNRLSARVSAQKTAAVR